MEILKQVKLVLEVCCLNFRTNTSSWYAVFWRTLSTWHEVAYVFLTFNGVSVARSIEIGIERSARRLSVVLRLCSFTKSALVSFLFSPFYMFFILSDKYRLPPPVGSFIAQYFIWQLSVATSCWVVYRSLFYVTTIGCHLLLGGLSLFILSDNYRLPPPVGWFIALYFIWQLSVATTCWIIYRSLFCLATVGCHLPLDLLSYSRTH